jgi:acetylornithine deacetylase/succinyl-diaminopimelate desuccinylase-like protein
MSFEKLPKGSILYIKAKDLLFMDIGGNGFTYPGATSPSSAGGQPYPSSVATTNKLTESSKNNYVFRRVSEHNRSDFNIGTNRIKQSTRMANGTLREFIVADKKTFNVSWTMLPSYRNETVDGGWAAEDLKAFYESSDGKKAFEIKINTSHNPSNIEDSSFWESTANTYTVVFTSCDFTVVKRGLQPYWSVNISLEQV